MSAELPTCDYVGGHDLEAKDGTASGLLLAFGGMSWSLTEGIMSGGFVADLTAEIRGRETGGRGSDKQRKNNKAKPRRFLSAFAQRPMMDR